MSCKKDDVWGENMMIQELEIRLCSLKIRRIKLLIGWHGLK